MYWQLFCQGANIIYYKILAVQFFIFLITSEKMLFLHPHRLIKNKINVLVYLIL